MLDNELFPTPPAVLAKMRQAIAIKINSKSRVFDPSAGNGAILDSINKVYGGDYWNTLSSKNLYAAEIEMDLRYVLQKKGYRVLASDFLAFTEPQKFPLVMMNPPFSQGCQHVLHAWQFVAPGGQLIALVNSETIRNTYSKERQLLANLIAQHGRSTELGQCFKDSERPTDVEVSMIVLSKPAEVEGQFAGFEDDRFQSDSPVDDEEFAANPLAHGNLIKALVGQYKAAEKALIAKHEANKALRFYCGGISRVLYDSATANATDALIQEEPLEEQLQVLKARFWATVFEKSRLGAKATSSFRDKFYEFAQGQCQMAFNEANILEIFMVFFGSHEQIMQDCLVSVFDRACSYDEKNRIHWEGWKTNDAWKVNKRVIVPYGVEYDRWGTFSSTYGWKSCDNFLDDLDKVMCYISGANFDGINSASQLLQKHIKALNTNSNLRYDDKIASTFFHLRIFKKGTVHIDFRDLDLLDEFNCRAAQGKKWVPDQSSATQQSKRKRKSNKLTVAV